MAVNVSEDIGYIRECRSGNAEAFGSIVRKYQDRIFNLSYRLLSDFEEARDMTQATFIKAFESLDRFKGASAFYTWLYRIALNMALDARKAKSRRPRMIVEELDELAVGSSRSRLGNPEPVAPVGRLISEEQLKRIVGAIDELDDAHRTVVVLRDIEGLDYRGIADVTELPIGTIKSRLHRARLMLRDKLKDMVS